MTPKGMRALQMANAALMIAHTDAQAEGDEFNGLLISLAGILVTAPGSDEKGRDLKFATAGQFLWVGIDTGHDLSDAAISTPPAFARR